MQSNLTPRAQQAIRNAKKEAIFYNDCFVAPEHLLLGLLIIPGGPTGEFLSSFGVTEEALRRAVEGKYAGSDEENDNDILHGEPVFFFCEASEDPLEEGFPDRTFFNFVSHEFFLSHFTGVQPAG